MGKPKLNEEPNDPLEIVIDDGNYYAYEDIVGVFISKSKTLYHLKWKCEIIPTYTLESNVEDSLDFDKKQEFWTQISSILLREKRDAKKRMNGNFSEAFRIYGLYACKQLSEVYYFVEHEEINNMLNAEDRQTTKTWKRGSDLVTSLVKTYLRSVNNIVMHFINKYAEILPPDSVNVHWTTSPETEQTFRDYLLSPASVQQIEESIRDDD